MEIGTEALLCAAQEQAIRTNYVKHYIAKTRESPLCRLCGRKGESVQHLVCGCEKLAQKEYKRRHDNVAKKVHWDFCKKNGLEHTEKWYEHVPKGVVENEEREREDNKERKGLIIDIAVPAYVRVEEKEREKVEKYQDLKREIGRLWNLKKSGGCTCSYRGLWKCHQRI